MRIIKENKIFILLLTIFMGPVILLTVIIESKTYSAKMECEKYFREVVVDTCEFTKGKIYKEVRCCYDLYILEVKSNVSSERDYTITYEQSHLWSDSCK